MAGRNKFDPVHTSLFEVIFTVPEALKKHFAKDEVLLTEHVTKISGLDALGQGSGDGGCRSSWVRIGLISSPISTVLVPSCLVTSPSTSVMTRITTSITSSVLGQPWDMDITTGRRALKRDYCAEWLRIRIANRVGDVYQTSSSRM